MNNRDRPHYDEESEIAILIQRLGLLSEAARRQFDRQYEQQRLQASHNAISVLRPAVDDAFKSRFRRALERAAKPDRNKVTIAYGDVDSNVYIEGEFALDELAKSVLV